MSGLLLLKNTSNNLSYFQYFKTNISAIALPKKFTFPFYYQPHDLTKIAANEIQEYLKNQTDFDHNFGLNKDQKGNAIGKMFGVLVVQNQQQELGYLAAFSGKLADESLPPNFVPPVYNVHAQHSFFKIGERELNRINQEIKELEKDVDFLAIKKLVNAKTIAVQTSLKAGKEKMKLAKKDRQLRRKKALETLDQKAFLAYNEKLTKERINDQYNHKTEAKEAKEDLLFAQNKLAVFTTKIAALKSERKNKSNDLQREIFENYQFLNHQKEIKKLTEIFPDFAEQQPPAGAGDCAAPKLLQYAFAHDLKPIAMGEFWWGVSPKTEIRVHKNFYPACRGRCKPILGHMLEGIEMYENPLLKNPAKNKDITLLFEDEALIIVHKPAGFLSVPGKEVTDSVYSRIKAQYPKATGPLIVHRLDMSTSGILVLTKTKAAHKVLQNQFIERTIKKRYIALLDGIVEQDSGYIDLPLRVDLLDRPRQLVCYEYGKMAKTHWKVVERFDGKTRIYFFPITGRTHQLRVHAAHPLGLNTPIVGDDLYGQKASRLHLHAEFIEFNHPLTGKKVKFRVDADF